MSEFQPSDTQEPDYDRLWDAWFDRQQQNGMVVLSRDEWNAKLDEAASIGYGEGRKDEVDEWVPALEALRSILEISREDHFTRGADSKLAEAGSIARLAIKTMSCDDWYSKPDEAS